MIEIEKNGTVVFKGEKAECVSFLKEKGLVYMGKDIPLLVLGHLATNIGYDIFSR